MITKTEADRMRIDAHLRRVEAQLRARDVSDLPPALQRARAINLDRLHEYRVAGRFPDNDDFVGRRVPYFIDDRGTVCAVGHLVVQSGFADVAQEIRARENNARLAEMTHPALPGWIAASGLTARECAQIQPEYCGCDDEDAPVCGSDGNTYANRCYAETCAGVEVVHEGVCEGATSGDWPPAGSSGGPASTESSTMEPDRDEKSGCRVAADPARDPALLLLLLAVCGRRRRMVPP